MAMRTCMVCKGIGMRCLANGTKVHCLACDGTGEVSIPGPVPIESPKSPVAAKLDGLEARVTALEQAALNQGVDHA